MEQSAEPSTSSASAEKQKKSEDFDKLYAAASEAFDQKNYEKCLQIMDQLGDHKAASLDLLKHNRAIAEFYKSNCVDHKSLEEALTSIFNEQVSNKKEPSAALRYNLAVINFQRHMWDVAVELLAPIADKLDGEEDKVKIMTSVLMLRLMFSLNDRNKASAFLNMVLTKYFPEENTSSGGAAGGAGAGEANAETSSREDLALTAENQNHQFKLYSMIADVLNRKAVIIPDDGSAEFAALKAHQLYIMKDFQMCAKQLQRIVQDPKNFDNMELNTCMGNNMGVIHMRVRHYALAATFYQRALSFENQVANEVKTMTLKTMGKSHAFEILYNLGISMLYSRRPHHAFQCFITTAKMYFGNPRLWYRIAEACIMDYDMNRQMEEKKPLYQVTFDPETLQRRFILKPKPKKVYKTSHNSDEPEMTMEYASLCLRNALHLIKVYQKSFYHPPAEEVVEEVDKDPESQPANPSTQPANPTASQQKEKEAVHEPKEPSPEPSISNSQSTLSKDSNESKPSKPADWKEARDNNFCKPSEPVTKEAFDQLLRSTYKAYSFVSLRTGDYIIALEMAKELLKFEDLTDDERILAHMYAGEALIMMQRYPEAHGHLDPCSVLSLNAFDFETKDWEVKSVEICQNIWQYNIAVAYALQGDYEAARTFISSVNHPIVQNKATSLKIFLQMQARKAILNLGPPNHMQPQPQPQQQPQVFGGAHMPPTPLLPHTLHGMHTLHPGHPGGLPHGTPMPQMHPPHPGHVPPHSSHLPHM